MLHTSWQQGNVEIAASCRRVNTNWLPGMSSYNPPACLVDMLLRNFSNSFREVEANESVSEILNTR